MVHRGEWRVERIKVKQIKSNQINMEQILQEIKKAMTERSMTGYAIAKATGMSFAQVYRVLRGENTSVNCVQDICKAVGLNITVTKASNYEVKQD